MHEDRHDELIDPEPFTIFLAVLGALGSVASLAGYAESKRDARRSHEDTRSRTFEKLVIC